MKYLVRQNLMFSVNEQKKIKKLNVLIAGMGGLGTNLATELHRIGVNKIYIIDDDKVQESDLNRQILYGYKDIHKKKVYEAKNKLDALELETEVIPIYERITPTTELPEDINIIFDALDSFEDRLILEKLSKDYKVPLIHGGINAWYGQIACIYPNRGMTLASIVPNVSRKSMVPSFSPVVSIVASIQVIEGIKTFLNKKTKLEDEMIIVDLEDYKIEKIRLSEKEGLDK